MGNDAGSGCFPKTNTSNQFSTYMCRGRGGRREAFKVLIYNDTDIAD